jgi:hypothetical protein
MLVNSRGRCVTITNDVHTSGRRSDGIAIDHTTARGM